MPAYQLLWQEEKEDEIQLKRQLEAELAECMEVRLTCRNKVMAFMVERGIWHISELNYSLRKLFHDFLEKQISPISYSAYEKGFDQIKQHSVRKQLREIKRSKEILKYENEILFLPYYPDQNVACRFTNTQRKADLVWDFRLEAPERMKRQIFQILIYLAKTLKNNKYLRYQMNVLRIFYQYCIEHKIEDIEMLELNQIQDFRNTLGKEEKDQKKAGIIDVARKILFLQEEEIHWKAHVWYLERFYFQPERIDPSNPVKTLSFLEVLHKRNRELLKQYMRYGLGITNLTIHKLRNEFLIIRNFLAELVQEEDEDICMIMEQQIDIYFKTLQERKIQAVTYNTIVMSIVHFFNFLQVRRYIEKMPFCADYYLKKVIEEHHDRSVEMETSREILHKLHLFPEEIRLMYLHLWGVGLRISEVCIGNCETSLQP